MSLTTPRSLLDEAELFGDSSSHEVARYLADLDAAVGAKHARKIREARRALVAAKNALGPAVAGLEERDAVAVRSLFCIRASSVLTAAGAFDNAWRWLLAGENMATALDRPEILARCAAAKAWLAAGSEGLSFGQRGTWEYGHSLAVRARRPDLVSLCVFNGMWTDTAADAPISATVDAERQLSTMQGSGVPSARLLWLRARLRLSQGDFAVSADLASVASNFAAERPEAVGIAIEQARAAVMAGRRNDARIHLGTAWPALVAQDAPEWTWAWWRDLARQLDRQHAVEPADLDSFGIAAARWIHLETAPMRRPAAVAGG